MLNAFEMRPFSKVELDQAWKRYVTTLRPADEITSCDPTKLLAVTRIYHVVMNSWFLLLYHAVTDGWMAKQQLCRTHTFRKSVMRSVTWARDRLQKTTAS